MAKYLLSTYRVAGEVPGAPQSPDEIKGFMDRLIEVERAMDAVGAFFFGGALDDADSAVVANVGDTLITDGPFAESKEQIAGFYIIDVAGDDEARSWARRVADVTSHPIEVRRFSATGRMEDMAG